ncbi:MAG: patatin family protein [Oscillospiraceae bacterium]|nr:patatin family protein [Oscillospiraceae bacterium]
MEPKTGLILEGGALRGLFTTGVIDVLMEEGIRLDGVVGVSAGATFGCNYVTHQIRRPLRYCVKYAKDPRFCSVRSLVKTGDMYGAEFCYHTIPEQLDVIDNETFVKSGIPFYCVATDVRTGHAVYHRCRTLLGDDIEWIRASASMPLASKIVEVGGYALLDGGVSDSIPLRYFVHKGYTRNVVVLTQPLGYQKKPNSMMPLVRSTYRKYPALVRAMAKRHIVYNRQLRTVAQAEEDGTAFVIRPPEKLAITHISHDEEEMRKVYAAGRQTMLAKLPELRAFLGI